MPISTRFPKLKPVLMLVMAASVLFGAGAAVYETLPPKKIVIVTGAEGGANYELGRRYREILAKSGVELQLRSTSGGLENLKRLSDPRSGVSVGFVQGGATTRNESPDLESLGTVFYEPLWLFFRSGIGKSIQNLRGRKVSIGPQGSAGRALALDLARRTRVDTIVSEFVDLPPKEAADKLIAGEIDAAFIVTGWDSSVVQQLLGSKGIELGSFQRADALVALYPFLNKLVLPAGVVDFLENRPASDVVLLAPKASLVVRSDLHPAVQHLLLSAAQQIHSLPGIFQKPGQFPAAETIDLPLSEEAQRFYKNGRPFFEEHLPFWMATLVERLVFIFLPLAILIYPALKFLPQAYDWMMRMRVVRLYDEMRSIESEINASQREAKELGEQLDRLDDRANALRLPKTYSIMVYTLRSHLRLVRGRLSARSSATPP
jgi:TRAP-type uncharacterized transport system substrate-binding protein